MALTKLSKNFQVTIPASLRRGFDLKEGDYLEASVEDGAFIFKPIQIREKNSRKKTKKSGDQE